ncbi:hypothetical protein [Clostridium gasigenes]|uniref:Uncharacterized protein n=1 Tax=Clostridium gasigenes TaxID=94869 RepID=A0A1H0N2P8_9CLOT|nr:hypothetical protein [Clostridium gasigenes]MBB6625225.1 hypothetical protein [Clostridium gasigenes]MBB6716231.1 hypothetical protein [Clostridium gasigenes]SDO87004.1 hypothetical protein SAMN04488529_101666 [Clostridium gasigenes]
MGLDINKLCSSLDNETMLVRALELSNLAVKKYEEGTSAKNAIRSVIVIAISEGILNEIEINDIKE